MSRWLFALTLFAGIALSIGRADAAPYSPPPLAGHVVDATGTLSPTQKQELDERLDQFRRTTGYAVVALVIPALDGQSIDDVAYETFNTWKVGAEGKDNGVLLVIAAADKRSRIETGKGVGGELTDIESGEILRQHVIPAVQDGDLYRAVDAGTRAIQASLVEGVPGGSQPEALPVEPPSPWYVKWVWIGGLLLLGLLAIIFPQFRWVLFALLQAVLMSRGGGRGGIGGGGYSGGGGRSGGGGASG